MDSTVVSYKQAGFTIPLLMLAGIRSVLLAGKPGIGKTAIAPLVQQTMGLQHLFMIKIGHHDPLDVAGLPVPDHTVRKTFFYPSGDLLPPFDLKGGLLWVWDEIGDASTPCQNLVCQAVHEGRFHNYVFPENTYHLLTTNRVSDRSGAQRIMNKLANRGAWLDLEPLPDELFEHGWKNNWASSVLSFLKTKGNTQINPNDRPKDGWMPPTYFNSFDPTDPQQLAKPIFASSRSIEGVSKLILHVDKHQRNINDGKLLPPVASLCGTPWATAFVPYRSESAAMPDIEAILRGDRVAFPKKESVLWTTAIDLVGKATRNTWKHVDNFLRNGPMEYQILSIRMAFDTRANALIGTDFNATLQRPEVKQAMEIE